MNAANMLDVIHLYYEENMIPTYEQELEIRDAVRTQLYLILYESEYQYAVKQNRDPTQTPEMPTVSDLPPEMQETKPYIPPTEFEDFQAVGLDAPMGY